MSSLQILDKYGVQAHLDEMQRISPSVIGDMDICLKRAGYNRDRSIPRGTGEGRIVGTSYHGGLEDYYRVRIDFDEGPFDPADYAVDAALRTFNLEVDKDDEREKPEFTAWETSKDEAWARIESMVRAYFDGHHYWAHGMQIVGVEQKIYTPLTDGWVLVCVVDLIVRGPGGIVVVDHKSAGKKWQQGKESARKNAQAVLYAWAWWMATGEVPSAVSFDIMTYKGEFQRRMTQVSPEAMRAVLDKAIADTRILDLIPGDQLPANPSSNLCSAKYCDHFDRCPLGSALL